MGINIPPFSSSDRFDGGAHDFQTGDVALQVGGVASKVVGVRLDDVRLRVEEDLAGQVLPEADVGRFAQVGGEHGDAPGPSVACGGADSHGRADGGGQQSLRHAGCLEQSAVGEQRVD